MLKEHPVDSVQWAEVVLTVNAIIKVQTLIGVGGNGDTVGRDAERLLPLFRVGCSSSCCSVQGDQGVHVPTCREGRRGA